MRIHQCKVGACAPVLAGIRLATGGGLARLLAVVASVVLVTLANRIAVHIRAVTMAVATSIGFRVACSAMALGVRLQAFALVSHIHLSRSRVWTARTLVALVEHLDLASAMLSTRAAGAGIVACGLLAFRRIFESRVPAAVHTCNPRGGTSVAVVGKPVSVAAGQGGNGAVRVRSFSHKVLPLGVVGG